MSQVSFSQSISKTSKPLELIHFDLWGPSPVFTLKGYKYYAYSIDDFSRFTWFFSLKNNSEIKTIFEIFFKLVERQFETNIKCFQYDCRGEYKSLVPILNSLGIMFRHPCLHTH